MDINWGDVPTWLSAVVSGAALVAASIAGHAAHKTLKIEMQREQGRQEEILARRNDVLADQAKRVVCWAGRGTDFVEMDGPHHPDSFECPAVMVRNASELLIYDVVIEQPLPQNAHEHGLDEVDCNCSRPYWGGHVAPGQDSAIPLPFSDVVEGLISPELMEWVTSGPAINDDAYLIERTIEEWSKKGRPAISFTDARGQRWIRQSNGSLERTDPLPKRGPQE